MREGSLFDEALRRGLESYVAEMLRIHVAEGLLARPEIRAALGPQHFERVRAEVLDRLRRSEEEGREARPAVSTAVSDVLSLLSRIAGRPGSGGEGSP
ncbi:MAG: hypothetical protein FJ087_09130 [Deltaproteobacteria bacterium]|nr:hypothetical protein [Deltaproteobacteria bacterium]